MVKRNDWTDLPGGMLDDLADDDVFLVQDVSDTTESPEGTTKGVTRVTLREGLSSDGAFNGTTTFDGPTVFMVRSSGGGVYLRMESDTANYITFSDDAGNSLGYIDIPSSGGVWNLRNSDGDIFLKYTESTGQVTFPDGGVPASDIKITDSGGYFTASDLEAVLQEIGTGGFGSGGSGFVAQTDAPANTTLLWYDTDAVSDAVGVPAGGGSGQVLKKASATDYDLEWADESGPTGPVDTSGTPVANDFARFTDASTIEGRSYAEVRADLDLEVGTDIQAYDADLAAIAALTTTAYGRGLLTLADQAALQAAVNVEAGADVTDATNVDAAGAVMNTDTSTAAMSFVVDEDDMVSDLATKVPTQQSVKAYVTSALSVFDADLATFSVPASTTISAFGATLVDDASASTARTTLGVIQEKVYSWPGDAVVNTGAIRIYFKRAATILNVYASASTAPTGASLILDVHKNGTTIFTTQGNRPTIAAASFTDMTSTPDVTAVAASDFLTVDIDQIGSTIAGADIVVGIEYRDD